MPVSTREKRAAAAGLGLPFTTILPLPDGTISAADRKQVVGVYPLGEGGGGRPLIDGSLASVMLINRGLVS